VEAADDLETILEADVRPRHAAREWLARR